MVPALQGLLWSSRWLRPQGEHLAILAASCLFFFQWVAICALCFWLSCDPRVSSNGDVNLVQQRGNFLKSKPSF